MTESKRSECLAVPLGLIAVTLAVLHQQAGDLYAVPDRGDPIFSMWRMAWVQHQVSPDGRCVAGLEAGTTWRVYSLDGGAATTMLGVAKTDEAVSWTADGRAVIVAPTTGQPPRLERVDLTTGARTRIHDLRPPTGDGLRAYFHNVTFDGDQFTYWGTRTARTLYVVSGVRQ